MFWKLTSLSASSPVDAVLDKDNFTLDELLDEEEIIQECKAPNSRLINFLRERTQVEQLLRYVVEEPPEDADSKRAFKFPFVACEVFICEIDDLLWTLVQDEELMNYLFSFLDPDRPHSPLLAGYFSKVVVSLMLRKTAPLMNYVQAHQDIIRRLVDLIGITSIMEVLVRLVGADDHVYSSYMDIMQWLSDSNLLEMVVDKLSPSCPPEVQANAAETLCAITRNIGSTLASQLSSSSFVARVLANALEDSHSKSGLVHSLSVCISLLDPRRSVSSFMHSVRGQHMYEAPVTVNPDTVSAMLPKLGDLLSLLNVSSDEKVLPTPYGELRPPLGKHRLKIVEFIAVLLKAGNMAAEGELVNSGTIRRIIDLFFEYPYNNALHHHVESIISSCMESSNENIVGHLFKDCDLLGRILHADRHPLLSSNVNQPTIPASDKKPARAGNLGHVTRISNKIAQLGASNRCIQTCLQDNGEWNEWQMTALQERNMLENVYRWGCGRPTALHDRMRDSDDDDIHDRDYDVAALANNLSQALRPDLFGREGSEEFMLQLGQDNGGMDRDDEDVYFDDESAEVVISSLRLGDNQGSLFTNSDWFTFRDERIDDAPVSTSLSEMMDEINLNGTVSGAGGGSGNSSSDDDDEVVVGEEDEVSPTNKDPRNEPLDSDQNQPSNYSNPNTSSSTHMSEVNSTSEKTNTEAEFQLETPPSNNEPNSLGTQPLGVTTWNPFVDAFKDEPVASSAGTISPVVSNGDSTSCGDGSDYGTSKSSEVGVQKSHSLFEEDVEFVGVEPEGTEKAMEHALKEGIVGEAGAMKRNNGNGSKVVGSPTAEEKGDENAAGLKEFNDANYWRVEQEVAVLE